MGKIIDTYINDFSGGISNDPRDPRENVSRMVSNFDILTDKYRLIPYVSSDSGNADQATSKIKNYCIAKLNSTPTYALYGLGISGTGTDRAKIFYKTLSTGGTYDLDTSAWNVTAAPESSNNNSGLSYECFVYYENQGKIFMVDKANGQIMVADPDGGDAWVENVQAITVTYGVAQGLVASDDILYIPYDNKIASKNGSGSWNLTALTLPAQYRIKAICEYGNYIAIGCEPNSGATPGFGGSRVFLWDKTSTSWSDVVDWGDERIHVLDEVNGSLVGISIGTGTTRLTQRIIFRYLSVSSAIKFFEITSATSGTTLTALSRKLNNRLYYLLEVTIDGVSKNGVWSVGGVPGAFSVVHERTTNNDSTFTDLELFGFQLVGDYVFISYADSSVNAMTKSKISTYTATSIYEKRFNSVNSATWKKFVGAKVMTDTLPAGGQIVLKYKKDGETAFTTIFTNTTVTAGSFVTGTTYTIISVGSTDFTAIGASANTVGVVFTATGAGSGTGVAAKDPISHAANSIESTGATLPDEKELTLRIESTGGAVVTVLLLREDALDKDTF